MNVIFCDFDDVEWLPVLKKISQIRNFNHVHIIDRTKFTNESKSFFKKLSVINVSDAITNKLKVEKVKKCKINKKYFDKNFKIYCEMIKRFDPLNSLNLKEKKKNYYKTINFWLNFLTQNKISLFFSKTTPHQVYDYIIYLCCKYLKIKTIFFGIFYLKNYCYLIQDINERNIYTKLHSKKFPSRNFKIFKMLKKRVNKEFKVAKPQYIKNIEYNNFTYLKFISLNILKLFFVIMSFKFLKKSKETIFYPKSQFDIFYKSVLFEKVLTIRSIINKFFMQRFYQKNSQKIDFTKNYIFFASQFQPESTNCPEGGEYSEIIKTLKIISKNIDKKYYIYYKENPATFHPNPLYLSDRIKNINFYKELKKIKNLKFLELSSDTYKLIDNAKCTITVAGQIGFECILKKRKCVVFSNIWYKDSKYILNYSKKNFNNKLDKFISSDVKNDNFFKNFTYFLDSSLNSKAIQSPSVLKSKKEISKNVLYILKHI